VCFLDADVLVRPETLAQFVDLFEAGPELTAAFGSYDAHPTSPDILSQYRNLLHHFVHQSAQEVASTFWAGCGAIRRPAFLAAGGFDPSYTRPSIEDIELGMRVAGADGAIRLDPALQGKHLKRWTLGSMIQTDLVRRGAPWVALVLERGSGSTALNLGWRHRVSAGACVVLVAALATRSLRAATVSVATLLLLNGSFYLLLKRRRGWSLAIAGVPLHVVHHLVSAAALPAGVALYVHGRLSGSSSKFA